MSHRLAVSTQIFSLSDAALPTAPQRALPLCRSTPESGSDAEPSPNDPTVQEDAQIRGDRPRRQADSTDFIASTLTRRFGLAGGLAWLGFLTFGVVGEQIKTRIEVAQEEADTRDVTEAKEVTTPEGIKYVDLRVGGGQPPQKGYLVVLAYKAYANGDVFEDTTARGKPIVFIYGSRPFSGGICPGVEIALRTMRAGGKRRVTVPAALGFGDGGTTLRPTEHVPEKQGNVPPGAELEYELELQRVSIPPS